MNERTYQGGCHCGAVRYAVKTALAQSVTCNCSICRKTGAILTFVPAAAFELKSGSDNLADYTFNRHLIHHLFCKTCGIRSFARGRGPDGSETVAVNVRCLDDVDIESLQPTFFDGAAI